MMGVWVMERSHLLHRFQLSPAISHTYVYKDNPSGVQTDFVDSFFNKGHGINVKLNVIEWKNLYLQISKPKSFPCPIF